MRARGLPRAPGERASGPEGAGFALAQERLGPGRIHHCMRWIGICERAFDMTCARAADAASSSPGVRLASRQVVQHCDRGQRGPRSTPRACCVLRAAGRIDARAVRAPRASEVSLIKFYVAGVLDRVLDRAVQVHGALGLTDDTILAVLLPRTSARRASTTGPTRCTSPRSRATSSDPYGVDVEI